MTDISRYFYIFQNKFSGQNSDVYIIISISQMEKLRFIRFDNISQDIQAISCKSKIQIEDFKISNPINLHIYYTVKTRLGQSKLVFFLLLVLYRRALGYFLF